MTARPDWAERGRELGVTLDGCNAVVVVGEDEDAVVEVAFEAARLQAQHRRVVIGDLIGEHAAIQSFVPGDEPPGLMDSLLFGVSFARIMHHVPDGGELFVMPSGAAPLAYDELLTHPRWARFASGFAEDGALLMLVAPVDAEGLTDLVRVIGGVVVVGDVVPPDVAVSQAIAWLRPPREAAVAETMPVEWTVDEPQEGVLIEDPPPSVAPEAPDVPTASTLPAVTLPAMELATGARPTPLVVQRGHSPLRAPPRRWKSRPVTALAVVATLIAAAVAFFWLAVDPSAERLQAVRTLAASESLRALAQQRDSVLHDALRRDSAAAVEEKTSTPSASRADTFPVLAPSNAGDSLRSASFSVQLQQTNTRSLAILSLRDRYDGLPATSYAPDSRTGNFMLVAGAYPARASAETLLVQLRARRILAPGAGSVSSLPYAFLVEPDVPLADVRPRLARFAARGQPVYALRQERGTAHLYFGAYASPQQAALAVPALKETGVQPVLVYRIGRVF
ncbi:MAG: hypothetical protein H0W68_01385 [Gemmatimonadaceae bacterium]|nr:hypothetical protein [Gemmatimonadaceae bacterium]